MKKPKNNKRASFKFSAAMLIDDSEIDNFINQKIIESNYFAERIYVNTGGISAIEFLKNLAINEAMIDSLVPDVIFIDLNMPIMDGIQFIDQFKHLSPRITSRSKLVILTSSFNPEDKEKVMDLYKEAVFLNKPLTDDALLMIN